jgi:hypothetical protein
VTKRAREWRDRWLLGGSSPGEDGRSSVRFEGICVDGADLSSDLREASRWDQRQLALEQRDWITVNMSRIGQLRRDYSSSDDRDR